MQTQQVGVLSSSYVCVCVCVMVVMRMSNKVMVAK